MTLDRSEVMSTHYQLQLQLIVVLIFLLTVESIIQYMYRCMYIE